MLCFLFVRPTSAQQVTAEPPISDERLLQTGIEALETGHYDEAVKTLTALVNATPDFYRPGTGSAAYWAGRALVAVGRPEQARMVWLLGQKSLEKAGRIDPRLSDAYIEFVFREKRETDYAHAAAVYLRLLERASDIIDLQEQCIVKRHLAQALPLLAMADQARLSESKKSARCKAWQPTEEAGLFLAAWWRSRDPRLATERNERLEEHLRRVVEARQYYGHDWHVSGLDDRGEIYVRYGKPSRQVSLRSGASFGAKDPGIPQPPQGPPASDGAGISQDGVQVPNNNQVGIAPVDFGPGEALVFPEAGTPKGELWFYEHIDSQGYYFFVQEGRYFRIGQVSDMAYNYRGPGGESKRYALLYQHYEKLAFIHPDFAARYTEMENLPNQVNAGSFGQSMRSLWVSTRAVEGLEAYERDQRMPVHYDEAFANIGSLPVALRSARFLDTDGTTRTEIYWYADLELPMQGELSEALATLGHPGPSGAPLLHLTVVQQDARYRPRAVQTEYYLAEDENEKGAPALPVHTTLVRGDTGLYHVALQWEQYAAQIKDSDSVEVTKETPLRTATERIASLTALSNAEDRLEMSDVVPVAAEALISTLYENEHPHIQPYPFSALAEQDSLGLYFEIYHLTFGADDQTHYSVEYEIVQRKARGGVLRFRKQEVRTATQTSYTGTTRTARDAILLTLEEWVDGELEVIVHVTDETTGQQVERSVLFETTKRNN